MSSSIAPTSNWVVKTLTEQGMKAMKDEWARAVADEDYFNSGTVLTPEGNTTDFLGGKCSFKGITHGGLTKKELSERIYSAFSGAGERVEPHLSNRELWCWFMCKIGPSYHLKIKAHEVASGAKGTDEKIILSGDGYRHHMANLAWVQELIQEHDIGHVMLTEKKKNSFGDFQEQVTQGHILKSHACLKLLDEMAYDTAKEYWVMDRNVPENRRNQKIARYFKAWLYKLDTVHDVYSMSYELLKTLAIDSGRFSGTWIDGKGVTRNFDLLA